MDHDAIIDKYLGDGVMALFLADMPTMGERTCDEMMSAAAQIIEDGLSRSLPLDVGVSLHLRASSTSRAPSSAGPGRGRGCAPPWRRSASSWASRRRC